MNNKLPCAVVRDLLPSYVEGLTEAETTRLVDEHLADCPECTARCTAMQGPEQPPQEKKQVDYLKQVRRRQYKKILLACLGTLVAIALTLGVAVFAVGTPLTPEQMQVELVEQDEEQLTFSVELETAQWGYRSLIGKKVSVQDGVASVTMRKVLPFIQHHRTGYRQQIDLDEVHQVIVCGRPVWQDGIFITDEAARMQGERLDYVGSASDDARLLGTIPLPDAAFSLELHTAAEPYGLTLHFKEPLSTLQQDQMRRCSPLVLALIDNLGVLNWTCPDGAGDTVSQSVTADQVQAHLPELVQAYNSLRGTAWEALPLKQYGVSPRSMQQLCSVLGM